MSHRLGCLLSVLTIPGFVFAQSPLASDPRAVSYATD